MRRRTAATVVGRRLSKGFSAFAIAVLPGRVTASAQATVGIGATAITHFSDSDGGTPVGGMAFLAIGKVNGPLAGRVDATVAHQGITSFVGTADLTVAFARSATSLVHPYLLAGAGFDHTGGATSATRPVAKVGLGFEDRIGRLMLFAESTANLTFRGHGIGTTHDLQLNLGMSFGRR